MKMYILLLLVLSFVFEPTLANNDDETGIRVSLINLISTPERYHGKFVFVSGYAEIEYENNVLCFSEKPLSSKDCLWIDIGEDVFDHGSNDESIKKLNDIEDYWGKFNKKKISLRGYFDMENDGHFGSSSGGIKKIREVYLFTPQGVEKSSPP